MEQNISEKKPSSVIMLLSKLIWQIHMVISLSLALLVISTKIWSRQLKSLVQKLNKLYPSAHLVLIMLMLMVFMLTISTMVNIMSKPLRD